MKEDIVTWIHRPRVGILGPRLALCGTVSNIDTGIWAVMSFGVADARNL